MEQQTATIEAERQDKWADKGNNPVNPVIVNPVGKLPAGAWEKATKKVQANYTVDDFAFNGQQIEVGHIVYEPSKGGEIIEIEV